jgi:UDP-N-acetylmuramate dehydrogenase
VGLTVLGGGSNVVLRRRVAGVVCLVRMRGIRLEPEGAVGVLVTAAAGERWHDLVRYTLGQGLAGLENLSLIPGSVGAAPIQNIGAYGVELSDRFVSLRAFDICSGQTRVFHRDDCRFAYRDSCFKRPEAAHLIILDVTVRLTRTAVPVIDYPDLQLELKRLGWSRPSPVQVAEAVIRVRRRKLPDPRRIGNVGSFFKNPQVSPAQGAEACRRHPALSGRSTPDGRVKLSAAQLIDACGWKGRVVGRVGVWHRQPLVLVNRGGATGADILAVSEDIRRDVNERFGVSLELEPQVIGQD